VGRGSLPPEGREGAAAAPARPPAAELPRGEPRSRGRRPPKQRSGAGRGERRLPTPPGFSADEESGPVTAGLTNLRFALKLGCGYLHARAVAS